MLSPVEMGARVLILKSKAQHEGRVRAIFKNKTLAPISTRLNTLAYKFADDFFHSLMEEE